MGGLCNQTVPEDDDFHFSSLFNINDMILKQLNAEMTGRISTMKRNHSNDTGENSRKQGLENRRQEVITSNLTMQFSCEFESSTVPMYINSGKKNSSSPIIRN